MSCTFLLTPALFDLKGPQRDILFVSGSGTFLGKA
jgi:hypothetical protein